MGSISPGWVLGVGLTTPPHKKLPVRKPEMWPQKEEEVHYRGEGPNWAVVPMKKMFRKHIAQLEILFFGIF